MQHIVIETPHLEIIAATEELIHAEIEDRARFATLLNAQVPPTWPPQFYDLEATTYTLNQLEGKPELVGWWSWYIVRKATKQAERVLVGLGGFKGAPNAEKEVEVGYSVLEEFQNCGYASKAVACWLIWAFSQGAHSVTAETMPELGASIRVLEKSGFAFMGAGSEEGVILYRKELEHE